MNNNYQLPRAGFFLLFLLLFCSFVSVSAQQSKNVFFAENESKTICYKLNCSQPSADESEELPSDSSESESNEDYFSTEKQSAENFRFKRQNKLFQSKNQITKRNFLVKHNFSPRPLTKDFQNKNSSEKIEAKFDASFAKTFFDDKENSESSNETFNYIFAENDSNQEADFPSDDGQSFRNFDAFKENKPNNYSKDDDTNLTGEEKFHWKPALIQSGIFLGIQHGFRMMQKRTTRELGGPFFSDWGHSVKNLRGWADGDIFFINYVAHPLQGAATGRIFINNSDNAKKQEFGKSKDYWASRLKAMAWSALWSTQFELGPISEASIGNVGIHDDTGRSRMGWVDLIITPTAGTGFLIGEDMIDKYVLKDWLEKKFTSRTKIKLFRSILTPTTSFANILRGKKPWKRDNR